MKTNYCFLLAVALMFGGCGDKPNQPPQGTHTTSSGGSVATAPVDYLGAMGKAQQNAVKTVDTTSVNQAIQQFNVGEGRNPKGLNELVEKHYMPLIPTPPPGTKLEYDADAGTVRVVKQ